MLIFVGSAFFRDDTRLRALRFLDHMLVCTFISPHKLRIITETFVGYHMYVSIEKVLYVNEDLFGVFHVCGSRDVKIRARVQQFLENFQTFSSMSFS
jgi:predicted PP-loop superfamily ATPase